MDTTLMTQIATRVVAWHNRHPLARRITLAQVRSIGVVALPFARIDQAAAAPMPDAASAGRVTALRARLLAPWRAWLAWRARRKPAAVPDPDRLQAVFDEDFVGGLPPGVARQWAERHAVKNRPGEDDWPRRDVPVDAHFLEAVLNGGAPAEPPAAEPAPEASDEGAPVASAGLRYALTAAIERDGVRHRLLLDTAPRPAVLGRRAYSPLRLAAVGGLLAALATAALLLPWLGRGPHAPAPAAAAPAASKPAAAGSGPAPASSQAAAQPAALAASAAASDAVAAAEAASAAASQAVAAASAAAPASAGAAVHPTHAAASPEPASAAGHGGQPVLDDSAKLAARLQSQSLRSGAQPGAHSAGPQASAPAPAAGPVFALVSRSAPSQAEPLVALERMKLAAAPLETALPGTRVELMQSSGRWSAVWWPFHSRADASQARWAAALKGVTVEVVEF